VITREQVEGLFEHTRQLRREGRVDWDIDGMCRWSYFFADSSEEKLVRLGEHLRPKGYQLVGLLKPGDDDENQDTIYLQVDRVEVHTVESLLVRNSEFYEAARQFQIRDYDGMDNGPIDGP